MVPSHASTEITLFSIHRRISRRLQHYRTTRHGSSMPFRVLSRLPGWWRWWSRRWSGGWRRGRWSGGRWWQGWTWQVEISISPTRWAQTETFRTGTERIDNVAAIWGHSPSSREYGPRLCNVVLAISTSTSTTTLAKTSNRLPHLYLSSCTVYCPPWRSCSNCRNGYGVSEACRGSSLSVWGRKIL